MSFAQSVSRKRPLRKRIRANGLCAKGFAQSTPRRGNQTQNLPNPEGLKPRLSQTIGNQTQKQPNSESPKPRVPNPRLTQT